MKQVKFIYTYSFVASMLGGVTSQINKQKGLNRWIDTQSVQANGKRSQCACRPSSVRFCTRSDACDRLAGPRDG